MVPLYMYILSPYRLPVANPLVAAAVVCTDAALLLCAAAASAADFWLRARRRVSPRIFSLARSMTNGLIYYEIISSSKLHPLVYFMTITNAICLYEYRKTYK